MEKYMYYKGAKFLRDNFNKQKADAFIKKDKENKALLKKIISDKKRKFAKDLIEIEETSKQK